MEFQNILALIDKVSNSTLTEFELEEGHIKITIKTDRSNKSLAASSIAADVKAPAELPGNTAAMKTASAKSGGQIVKSPIVGTFYRAFSPDSDPIISVGDEVHQGQVVGIIEAMKLMNEVECEFDGVVEEILVENESVVEYGQPLFVIGQR